MRRTLLAISLICGLPLAYAQTSATPVTVVMTSASPMTQAMSLVLAMQIQAQGGQVDLLLCDKAADLVLQNATGEALKPQQRSPAQMLDAAMKKGVSAAVCALYLPNTGHAQDALKSGVSVARPDAMGRALMQAERRVLAF